MGYFDKARKREANRKMTQEVLNSPEFKEYMRKHEEQAVLNAFGRFCFIMCGFLETRHGYKKEGLLKFLNFVRVSLSCTEDDENFFKEYCNYYKDEYNLDVLDELGLGLEMGEECSST